MGVKKFCLSALLVLLSYSGYSQLAITQGPANGAFLARNPITNSCQTTLEGSVSDLSYTALDIRIFKAGKFYYSIRPKLKVAGSTANFSTTIILPAGLFTYKIQYKLTGPTTLIEEVDGVMVGDVYLVQGQSNAVAASYSAFDPYFHSTYVRSFGTSSANAANVAADKKWYQANGASVYNKGSVGQWAAVMGKHLVDSTGIPICLFNGAVGGTRITQHQRDSATPMNLNTIYGRVLYRIYHAGLQDKIRGILYFQGESDGSRAALHDSLFIKLHSDWKKDYASFERLYVIQVRKGCGAPSIELRNVQRLFEDKLPNCTSASANGLNAHDGCHYKFVDGYKKLGKQMAFLVLNDFYGAQLRNIKQPHIQSCHYSNSARTELTLTMREENDSIYSDPQFHKLFSVQGDYSVSVVDGKIENNRVVLSLNQSTCKPITLTYDGLARVQPWVKNSLGMGLISFSEIPVEHYKPPLEVQACQGEVTELAITETKDASYEWTNLATQRKYYRRNIFVKDSADQKYSLIVKYDSSLCFSSDTFIVWNKVDPVKLPQFGADQVLCEGGEISFSFDSTGFDNFQWESVSGAQSGFTYLAKDTGLLSLTSTSLKACEYSTETRLIPSDISVNLPKGIALCRGEDSLLSVAPDFRMYIWNGDTGSHQYFADTGWVWVEVQDTFGCVASDSAFISMFAPTKLVTDSYELCIGDEISISKPEGIVQWYHDGATLNDSFLVRQSRSMDITYLDTNNCKSSSSVQVTVHEDSTDLLGSDTSMCLNSQVTLKSFTNSGDFFFMGEEFNDASIEIDSPGTYYASLKNKNSCWVYDTIQVGIIAPPDLSDFHDTSLCHDRLYSVALKAGLTYRLNGFEITDTAILNREGYYLEEPGEHHLEVIDSNGCITVKKFTVQTYRCWRVGVKEIDEERFLVYPNPFSETLRIEFFNEGASEVSIYNLSGQRVYNRALIYGTNVLDLTNMPKGVYVLSIDGNSRQIIKVE